MRKKRPLPNAPAALGRYIRRIKARKKLKDMPKAPANVGGRADEALGHCATSPSDVQTFGGRRHSQRRMRTQQFSTFAGKTGISYDPALALAYKFRRMLHGLTPTSIRQIHPETGAILWYFDATTRRRWRDAACTIPYGPEGDP